MLTRELKKSNANEVVHGKLIINISTNVNTPANHPGVSGNLTTSTNHIRNSSIAGSSSSSSSSSTAAATAAAQNQRDSSYVEVSSRPTSISATTPSTSSGVTQNGAIVSPSPGSGHSSTNRAFSSFEDQYGALPPG